MDMYIKNENKVDRPRYKTDPDIRGLIKAQGGVIIITIPILEIFM